LPHQTQPKHAPFVPLPAPVPQEPLQVERDSVPEGGALIASAAAATLASASDSHLELEAEYAAGLRADIDRRTYPPDSAQYRLHLPSGEVRVNFVVKRTGEVGAIRVVRSSGSSILDEQALSIVTSGHYPPIPAKAFAGETEHVFVVTIEFRRAK
jgi:protein TonB